MSSVLVIGDTHCPCMRDGYLDFLSDIKRAYRCKEFIHIGDLVDWHSISYHEKSPSASSAKQEYYNAKEQVAQIKKLIPKATWLIGNHDCLPKRKAVTASLPEEILRSYNDLWDLPKWEVVPRYGHKIIDGVMYSHGDKGIGRFPSAFHNAKAQFRSYVQGDKHQQGGIHYYANERPDEHGGLIFGMNVGCGVDHDRAEMDYGRKFNQKPIISCGVVEDGFYPSLIPMNLREYS
jgi:hypothetical protein